MQGLRLPGSGLRILAAFVALLVVATLGWLVLARSDGETALRGARAPTVAGPGEGAGTGGSQPEPVVAGAPAGPPARVCDGPSLRGPGAAPDGAVVVAPGQNLGQVVAAERPGTTFWLAPGVHRLGTGAYDQVVPHSGDRFVGAPGAVLDGRSKNRYAFAGDAVDVRISYLTIQNFGAAGDNNNEGVVNHDSAQRWEIRSSTVRRNAGAGLMVGSGNRVIGNCLRDNGQYGFNVYHADNVRDVLLQGNEITGNNTDDWEKREPGCGCTGGGKFWATSGARVIGNYVHDNRGVGLWADSNNTGFLFEGNYISENDAEGLMYETSYNALIVRNTFARNAFVKGPTNPTFPASAIYLSESGSDSRVPGPYGRTLLVSDNLFRDNWSGVVAWENADRFAGSPANTSTGLGTLVNPSVATVSACATAAKVRTRPYLDDCRWKTMNVMVENNRFSLDRAAVPGCTPAKGCGFNGVFSNYGTYPDWSPYQGVVVEENITFRQNNVWRNNTYTGSWQFMAEESGKAVSWQQWRSDPYGQDAGSTLG